MAGACSRVPGKTRGRTCERDGRGLSCGPSPGDPATASAFLRSPSPPASSRYRQTGKPRPGEVATSQSQGAKKAGAPRGSKPQVLAWITNPQAGAQLVEDMDLGLGTLKPRPRGPAGPTKCSASIISHGPCSLFEMDPYTVSTVCQPTDPSIRPSFHPPSIRPYRHPSSIQREPFLEAWPYPQHPFGTHTHTFILCSFVPHSPHLSIPPPSRHSPFCALIRSSITCQSTHPPLYLPTLSPTHPFMCPLINPPSDDPDVGQSIYPSTHPSGRPSIHQLFSH